MWSNNSKYWRATRCIFFRYIFFFETANSLNSLKIRWKRRKKWFWPCQERFLTLNHSRSILMIGNKNLYTYITCSLQSFCICKALIPNFRLLMMNSLVAIMIASATTLAETSDRLYGTFVRKVNSRIFSTAFDAGNHWCPGKWVWSWQLRARGHYILAAISPSNRYCAAFYTAEFKRYRPLPAWPEGRDQSTDM